MRYSEITEVQRAYHGSRQPEAAFIIGHTGKNSHTFGHYDSQRFGVFFTDNPDFAAMYGTVTSYELDLHHTLDLDNDGNVVYHFVGSFDAHDPDQRSAWLAARGIMYSNKHWQLFEDEVGERFVSYLLDLGYDSVTFTEYLNDDDDVEHRSQTIVVLNPSLITKAKYMRILEIVSASLGSSPLKSDAKEAE